MSDPQDVAESLDDDVLDDDGDSDIVDDELEDYPPDRPSGVGPMAMTPAEEAFPEPEGLRAWREEPDPLAVELDRRADELETSTPGRLRKVAGAAADEELATEDERLAEDPELGSIGLEGDGDVEELVATSPLVGDDEAELIADEVDAVGREPAEEEAMHLTGEPPLSRRDSYLDDEA